MVFQHEYQVNVGDLGVNPMKRESLPRISAHLETFWEENSFS